MGISQEEFERRREERRRGPNKARDEQLEKDREEIDRLEAETGLYLDTSLSVKNFVDGCPVMLGVRTPKPVEYKRFVDTVNRPNAGPDAKPKALADLGRVCWVYPSDETQRAQLIEANPALPLQVGIAVNKLAELEEESRGKG